ncbi:MAG: PAS domain-containing protein [bacterium]|nr:PAS domain-containing protein [bacterium]
MAKEIKPQEKVIKKSAIKTKVLALVAAMFVIPPFAWFVMILVSGLVSWPEWKLFLWPGAVGWVPFVIIYLSLVLYLANRWFKPIEEVLKNPQTEEAVKEKARENISQFPIRLFIAEVIYAIYGGYSALTGYFIWTGQRPPMMDERFFSVEFSSQAAILFTAIPFIFIISNLLNSALKIIGLSRRTAIFTIEKQFLIGNFALSGLAILSVALFYYGRTRYFGISALIFISILIIICFGFNKIIARRTTAVLKGMLVKVEKIGRGDLRQEVEVNSADELGLLAVGFNQMTGNLRKSRQELEISKLFNETILQSQVDMVMTCDMNRELTFVNKATCDALGYKPEELLGQEFRILYSNEEEYKGVLKLFKETIEKGFARNREIVFLTKNKEEIPAVYNTAALKDSSGKLIGGLGVARDMRETQKLIRKLEELTKNLENQVKKRTEELQQRVSELEKFHELTVGRELKMVELKEEIKKLEEKLKK